MNQIVLENTQIRNIFTLTEISTQLPDHYPEHYPSKFQDSNLAPFCRDLSQSEILSKIKPPLTRHVPIG